MTDKDLKRNVQNALDWEPSIDAAHIGVTIEGGVVTLHGNVRSYSEKTTAERVTLRVYGVLRAEIEGAKWGESAQPSSPG